MATQPIFSTSRCLSQNAISREEIAIYHKWKLRQMYLSGVEDLLDMKYVRYVPGVLGECPQRQGVLPHEARGEIREPFLFAPCRYPML